MTGRIADKTLWRAGLDRIQWAREFMPASTALGREIAASGVAKGVRIGIDDVLEPKTASVALALAEAGADVVVTCAGRNTDDAVAAALVHEGIPVYASSLAEGAEDRENVLSLLQHRPEVLIDDGAYLIRLAHEASPEILNGITGATEQTTSGVRPLRTMERTGDLRFAVVAGNDARTKSLFDNMHGTGQAVVLAIADLLGESLAGVDVVVAGFGRVGSGIARHAAAFGARVTVSETDPVAALQAVFAGYRVEPLAQAARHARVLISATGVAGTVDAEHLRALPDGAAVAVGGGVRNEIALDEAALAGAVEVARDGKISTLTFGQGRRVRILDDGHCINVSAAEGNPVQIMDLSFGVQLAAVDYLLKNRDTLEPRVYSLPREADDHVAALALASFGGALDIASPRQIDFTNSWALDADGPE